MRVYYSNLENRDGCQVEWDSLWDAQLSLGYFVLLRTAQKSVLKGS